MAICKLTVYTRVDGEENKIVRMGKIEEKEGEILLSYREENASVRLRVFGNRAEILREGDYSLFLPLIQGESTEGALGISGSKGGLPITTRRVEYAKTVADCKIFLDYELWFCEGSQKMQLEIIATEGKNK